MARTALLCILDGWGWRENHAGDNAIAAAATPNYARLLKECPHALLQTSGHAVGLPKGQMGNSEVEAAALQPLEHDAHVLAHRQLLARDVVVLVELGALQDRQPGLA